MATNQNAAVERELRLLMERWCPRLSPEPVTVTSMVDVFLGAYNELTACLDACGIARSVPLDDPAIPPHLASASWSLGELDSAVGYLVEESGAELGPARPPFQNVGPACPISDQGYAHVASYLVELMGPSQAAEPLKAWLFNLTGQLRSQGHRCFLTIGGA
jgi:hypothetical protein